MTSASIFAARPPVARRKDEASADYKPKHGEGSAAFCERMLVEAGEAMRGAGQDFVKANMKLGAAEKVAREENLAGLLGRISKDQEILESAELVAARMLPMP